MTTIKRLQREQEGGLRLRPIVGKEFGLAIMGALLSLLLLATVTSAQPASTSLQGFGFKIFRVESGLYPFVQVYFRTFDQQMRPLVNLNERNVGIMVKGRSYDPPKGQYRVESIRNRQEAVRSVMVLDASMSMLGRPFDEALKAAARFIDSKRPQDQVAILAIRDTKEGYEIVSNFERDPGALGRRLADVKCDGKKTRLYDAIGAAMQMCGTAPQGGVTTAQADYIVSCSILVFSDGRDEGSALSRQELNGRITALAIPIPIYSLAYSKQVVDYFKNLESISKNSFGLYYEVGEAVEKMQRIVEEIQNVLQQDYVLTFRSYVPVDGERHALKVAIEYPSNSGKVQLAGATFEAIEPPPVRQIDERLAILEGLIPQLPDKDPYLKRRRTPVAPSEGQ